MERFRTLGRMLPASSRDDSQRRRLLVDREARILERGDGVGNQIRFVQMGKVGRTRDGLFAAKEA